MNSKKLTAFGIASVVTTLIDIIAVSTYYWMGIDGVGSIGAFETINDGGNGYRTHCNSLMSELECGYLKSLQVAAVVTIIFGCISTALYFLPPRSFANLPTFLAVSSTLCQMIFGIIAATLFLYFKRSYYDDDGINREDDFVDSSSLYYDGSYIVWWVSTAITIVMTVSGYSALYYQSVSKV